jgi:hypothetical protein
MLTSIILAIFVLSFGGVIYLLVKKMPELNSLPQSSGAGVREHRLILNIESKIKGVAVFFEKQIFLHKILSWIKVITLKIETRVDHALHKVRKKAQQIDKNKKKF